MSKMISKILLYCLGVSQEKILDDIRDNVGSQFHRDHIIDKQDLANIQRAYGLDDVIRHSNDQTSVLAWIQEWENSDSSPIVYYKLQGTLLYILCVLRTITWHH